MEKSKSSRIRSGMIPTSTKLGRTPDTAPAAVNRLLVPTKTELLHWWVREASKEHLSIELDEVETHALDDAVVTRVIDFVLKLTVYPPNDAKLRFARLPIVPSNWPIKSSISSQHRQERRSSCARMASRRGDKPRLHLRFTNFVRSLDEKSTLMKLSGTTCNGPGILRKERGRRVSGLASQPSMANSLSFALTASYPGSQDN